MSKDNIIEQHAATLYSAYSAAVGGKSFRGEALPTWEEFAADASKATQANPWRQVARVSLGDAISHALKS